MTKLQAYRNLVAGSNSFRQFCLLTLSLHLSFFSVFAQTSVLDAEISISRQHTTMYGLLNQISRQTGHFFIYDSELIDNNKRIRVAATTAEVQHILNTILDDPALQFKVVDQHILIFRPPTPAVDSPVTSQEEEPSFFMTRGRILDQESGAPLPHATIMIEGKGMGTISNRDGVFHFRLDRSMLQESMKVSYMGYKSQVFPLSLIEGRNIDVMMETDYISMQEVIIRYYDPETIVREALSRRFENYSNQAVYQVNFYREGVYRNRGLLNYSEAIFKIYKAAYDNPLDTDQAVLLKSRNISNMEQVDTLVLKIKAGVRSALELDILKTMPAFFNEAFLDEVKFSPVDIVTKDSRSVYAIGFEQTNQNFLPIFMGILFIDMESLALLSAEFEVHPKYIDKSSHIFISRLDRGYQLNFDRIHYTVSYQLHNDRYHLSHLRGDLNMKFRKRNRIFSTRYYAFLEMVVGRIEKNDVSRFRRRETFKTSTTFIDQNLDYDYDFWEDYNIIPPEQHINEAFSQIKSKIESITTED